MLTRFPDTKFVMEGSKIEPFSSSGGPIEINYKDGFYLGVRTIPMEGSIVITLTDESGNVPFSVPISGSFFEHIDAPQGVYLFEVMNMESSTVQVSALITPTDLKSEFDSFAGIAVGVLTGSFLLLTGIVILAIFAIFVVSKKFRKTKV